MSQCFYETMNRAARVGLVCTHRYEKYNSKGWICPIDYLHSFLRHDARLWEWRVLASRVRRAGSERVRSRVAGIRAASLCALWPRRHPTETPRVESRAGIGPDRLSFNIPRHLSVFAELIISVCQMEGWFTHIFAKYWLIQVFSYKWWQR